MATRSKNRAKLVAQVVVVSLFLAVVVLIGLVAYSLVRMVSSDWLSSGEVIEVPDMVGKTETEAQSLLHDVGLVAQAKSIQRQHNDTQPAGVVFKQDPPARSKTKRKRIKLWISLGKASFIVPDLTGRALNDATQELMATDLLIGKITKIYRPDVTAGQVISQNPAPATEFSSSIPVDLVVADHENLPAVEMPNLGGQVLAQAEAMLVNANLHLAKVEYIADDTVPGTTVIHQNPGAGEEVQLGASVELQVALATTLMERNERSVTVRIPVPPGPDDQRVKIKVFDDHSPGGSVVYEEVHKADFVVNQQLDLSGRAVVYIFINDMEHPFREERL
ncbi:PASTA domain-containing protein [bacterium]|nr:PASTA domain-containing protein [bacterium]